MSRSVALILTMLALPAAARGQGTSPPAPATPTFLSRSAFGITFAKLVSDDPRFVWAARVDADVDIVDSTRARINFWGEYEGILGSERRLLDLNHENFVVEGAAMSRVGTASEIGLAFHHVSRHLSDRANPNVVAWNTVAFRAAHSLNARGTRYHGYLDLGRVLQHTYVDYAWTSVLSVDAERPVGARTSFVARGTGMLVGIDHERSDRDRQCGARIEAGIVVGGHSGGAEFYVAYERRIDGYPLARQRARWFEVGFKLLGR